MTSSWTPAESPGRSPWAQDRGSPESFPPRVRQGLQWGQEVKRPLPGHRTHACPFSFFISSLSSFSFLFSLHFPHPMVQGARTSPCSDVEPLFCMRHTVYTLPAECPPSCSCGQMRSVSQLRELLWQLQSSPFIPKDAAWHSFPMEDLKENIWAGGGKREPWDGAGAQQQPLCPVHTAATLTRPGVPPSSHFA